MYVFLIIILNNNLFCFLSEEIYFYIEIWYKTFPYEHLFI